MTEKTSKHATLETRKLELEVQKLELESKLIHGSPTASGEFFLLGAVDEDVYDLMQRMDIWSRNHPNADMTLVINSPGGTVMDGFAFYDFLVTLKKRGHRLTTKGIGMQASMGGILLQAGHYRIMSPHSWLLIHEVQGLAEGSFSEMTNALKLNARLQNQALDILSSRAKWSKTKIKNTWKTDTWLDAVDSLKAGFADEVEEDYV